MYRLAYCVSIAHDGGRWNTGWGVNMLGAETVFRGNMWGKWGKNMQSRVGVLVCLTFFI